MRYKHKRKSSGGFIQLAILCCLILTVMNGFLVYMYLTKEDSQVNTPTSSEKLEIKSVSAQTIVAEPLIVIDAGHGGDDPGTQSLNFLEKDINLDIALKLQQVLSMKGYSVLMTREDDCNIELKERANFANENNADLFISIHQNSYIQDSSVNGIEIYYNSGKSTEDETLAQLIQDGLIEKTGAYDRGIRVENQLVVTRQTNMPAVLIETAFLSNPTELKYITSNEYQNKVVEGIVFGIENFLSMQ